MMWLLMVWWCLMGGLSGERTEVELGPENPTFTLESLGYPEPIPADQEDTWAISSPEGTVLKLTCYDIRLIQDNPPQCDQDVFLVEDSAGLREEVCGSFYDREFNAGSNGMDIKLKIGPETSGGINCIAEYREQETKGEPEGQEVTRSSGQVVDLDVGGEPAFMISPDYPKPIRPNVQESWTLRVPQGSRIKIKCNDLRLYYNYTGCGDYALKIVDGENSLELCGTRSGYEMMSKTETVTLELRTGSREGGYVFCEGWGREMAWYGESTSPEPPPHEGVQSEEVDSSEHGGPPGTKATTCPCGWTNKESKRIVGGKETGVNEYPFMAALVYRGDRYSFCGASIITRYHALTAAHCTDGFPPDKLSIVVGEHDQSRRDESDVTEEIPVARVISHEKYVWYVMKYDISLLVLERPIEFSNKVGPVCLSRLQENITMQYVRNLGWGDTKYLGESSPVLREVDTRVTHLSSCNKVFPSVSLRNPTQICTFSHKKASCQGDSGGPVIWLDPQTNRYTQRGIASFGRECGTVNPSVKTDVSAYIDWIENHVKGTYPSENLCFRKED